MTLMQILAILGIQVIGMMAFYFLGFYIAQKGFTYTDHED